MMFAVYFIIVWTQAALNKWPFYHVLPLGIMVMAVLNVHGYVDKNNMNPDCPHFRNIHYENCNTIHQLPRLVHWTSIY